jgi:hypothetical protein
MSNTMNSTVIAIRILAMFGGAASLVDAVPAITFLVSTGSVESKLLALLGKPCAGVMLAVLTWAGASVVARLVEAGAEREPRD